jgi:hypothetical protein
MSESEPEILPEDEPPKSGQFIDSEEFYRDLTPEEIALGEHLGAETDDIDYVEDDGDDDIRPLGEDGR